jgi:hypothetical protein
MSLKAANGLAVLPYCDDKGLLARLFYQDFAFANKNKKAARKPLF